MAQFRSWTIIMKHSTVSKGRRTFLVSWMLLALALSQDTHAGAALNQVALDVRVGAAAHLGVKAGEDGGVHWESSAPKIAQVFQNGFVVGLSPGQAQVRAFRPGAIEAADWIIRVEAARAPLLTPSTLRQYADSREFMMGARKCYGSELNGQRASDPDEKRFTRANRVINPTPLRQDRPLDWELQPDTQVYDGAGERMGTVPPTVKIGLRTVPVSMFNFGASKVLGGRLCVYAFSVSIKPSRATAKLLDRDELKEGRVGTSAWLPLDRVVNKEALLERIGLGKAGLPALPLEATGRRVTGGNPKHYLTPFGELNIVRPGRTREKGSGPVPSHYLRRPSGTVNLVYSVPGFGLGGQGADSFLLSDGLEFYPTQGAKVFTQPTYFPPKHPFAGQISPQTMTFLYGAIKTHGSEPVYGWIAREALAPAPAY